MLFWDTMNQSSMRLVFTMVELLLMLESGWDENLQLTLSTDAVSAPSLSIARILLSSHLDGAGACVKAQ